MTIIIDKYKLAFFSAPKVACTSIKTALFEVENDFPFKEFFANGQIKHIHNVAYPAVQFEKINGNRIAGYRKLTMVREPVARLLSCYSNRVGYYRELSEEILGEDVIKSGLKANPTLHEFIENLEGYRSVSNSIWLHSNPLCWFLGSNADYYDNVYSMKNVSEFEATISLIIDKEFKLPRLQTGGEKISIDSLSGEEIEKIRSFYDEDYLVYGNYF